MGLGSYHQSVQLFDHALKLDPRAVMDMRAKGCQKQTMLPFKLVCSRDFYLPIENHFFPWEKYPLICNQLLETGIAGAGDFVEPKSAPDEDILLVHTRDYVTKLRTGTLSSTEEMQLEIPYSEELVEAFWLCAGGTTVAADWALRDGAAINIGGGFHHAFPDHGEGFCVINDVAIAIRRMQGDGRIKTALIVDCDVHQGNGNAFIFGTVRMPANALPTSHLPYIRESPAHDVFTISIHQENNYPAWKPFSSVDVNLPDGIGDDRYLASLDDVLRSGFQRFHPDLMCYIAGADPYSEDQLGGLALTIEGLKRRDELVFNTAKAHGIPVMVTLGGGYAFNVLDTVTIHCNTVVAAKHVFSSVGCSSPLDMRVNAQQPYRLMPPEPLASGTN